MPFILKVGRRSYLWEPTKSTPDWPKPVAEMNHVVKELKDLNVRSIIDFGCGKGRNAGLLVDNFDKVYLVEAEKNVGLVKNWIDQHRCSNCKALDFESFVKANIKVDACLLSFVLHTLPTPELRDEIINTIKSKLRETGILVLITPAHDSKYTDEQIKDAKKFKDGIARLFPDGTFSFYKNYDLVELVSYINKLGFDVHKRFPGNHRYIILASLRN